MPTAGSLHVGVLAEPVFHDFLSCVFERRRTCITPPTTAGFCSFSCLELGFLFQQVSFSGDRLHVACFAYVVEVHTNLMLNVCKSPWLLSHALVAVRLQEFRSSGSAF